jgi:hypothetical protein
VQGKGEQEGVTIREYRILLHEITYSILVDTVSDSLSYPQARVRASLRWALSPKATLPAQ